MPDNYFEEEEFQSKFDGKTLKRILGLTKPHLKAVIGFLAHHSPGGCPGCGLHQHQPAHCG